MKNFAIITNNDKKKNIDSGNMIKSLLESRGCKVTWIVMPPAEEPGPIALPEDTQIIITIGGDGTMVRTAQRTIGKDIPLIGFNKGHLGYLCDMNDSDIETNLDLLVAGRFETENRMMLTGAINGSEFNALNDIVVNNYNGQLLMKFKIYVNNSFLYSFDGDGLIVATPTGSTAYNLSANGPIVEPNTRLMLVTPINPHTLNSRSIVLDANDTVELTVEHRRSKPGQFASVFFDGAGKVKLFPDQRLVIKKAGQSTKFIKLDKTSFVERMKARLGD